MWGQVFYYSCFGLQQVGVSKWCVSTGVEDFRTDFLKIRLFTNMDTGSRSVSTSDLSKDMLFAANV